MVDSTLSIDDDLRRLKSETDQLSVLVTMLADEPAQVRDVWHWQWARLMECLETLHGQCREGLLSDAQARELMELSRSLQSNHKLVEALGCEIPPDISLMADASW